jgi:hypothetical protein
MSDQAECRDILSLKLFGGSAAEPHGVLAWSDQIKVFADAGEFVVVLTIRRNVFSDMSAGLHIEVVSQ